MQPALPRPPHELLRNFTDQLAMPRIFIATSNAGKLRDFAAAAAQYGVEIVSLPGFGSLASVVEDGATFEDNARKKAEHYSRHLPTEIVLADDSGLKVAALQGAPGVMSARYAFISGSRCIHVPNSLDVTVSGAGTGNAPDAENNSRLLAELDGVPKSQRQARFVCVIAAARGGKTLATFRGEAEGVILNEARGSNGFGYDPLFHSMELGKTFAELSAEEKAAVSHRGRAFRKVLEWYRGEESGAGARV